MTSPPVIRLVTSSAKSALVHLQCHVKPGASKQREGILSISDSVIEVCVAAQAKDGEANKAVREVFSDALKCPKSDVGVVRGFKSRDKTIAVTSIEVKGDEQLCISQIRDKLQSAADS
ncbi:YggU-like protein [Mollisia scopiformis]|uniref:YggU-like protein n=1 Tax=Mollisia scopiformis TaxID=149040 RepID=A0A194WSS0_MOLSC|nr:YggU-like protein [Mollisia scopiformis]KUJ10667.1 YggU-like protein [Mollisia scopiformis]